MSDKIQIGDKMRYHPKMLHSLDFCETDYGNVLVAAVFADGGIVKFLITRSDIMHAPEMAHYPPGEQPKAMAKLCNRKLSEAMGWELESGETKNNAPTSE